MISFLKRFQSLLFSFAIISVGWITYGHTLNYTFHFDDEFFLIKNPAIRHLADPVGVWHYDPTRFVAYYSLAINYAIHQFRLPGWHITNIFIHIIAALAAYWLTNLLLSTPRMAEDVLNRHKKLLAFFVGLIFVAHPVQTQSVTYIWQRCASLATMFYLLSLCCYLKARLTNNRKRFFILAGILAMLAFFTKEMTATLPVMIIVIEGTLFHLTFSKVKTTFLRHRNIFIVLAILLLFLPFLCLQGFFADYGMKAPSESFDGEFISGKNYLISQFRVLWTYIRLLFVPMHQNLDYEYHVSKSFFELKTFLGFAGLLLIIFGAIKLFKKHRFLSLGIFWFFITISIEGGIVPIDCLIYEHRLYLPMFGYALFLVSALFTLFQEKHFKHLIIGLTVISMFYAAATIKRNFVWKDDYTLWSDVIKKSPNKLRAFNNRGKALAEMGKQEEAIEDFNRGIAINPTTWALYINRGIGYQTLGRYKEAYDDFTKVIQNSRDAHAYNCRAQLRYAMGDVDGAIMDFSSAISQNRLHLQAILNRGTLYVQKKQYKLALYDFTNAISLDPFYAPSYENRGDVYYRQGKTQEALNDFSKAIELMPNVPFFYQNRAALYMSMGSVEKSLLDIQKTITLDPYNTKAYFQRGILYSQRKEYDKALSDFMNARNLGYPLDPKILPQIKALMNKNK
ncbi:MAG: tetratricopeptide repeat protein [Candidatus Omnitrophica bacterium]|nr:tetratricopeptide repeat protein [Candidatus Omnitrophota bacterium]